MKRVGIVLHAEAMGDCLFAIPVIRYLHRQNHEDTVFDLFTHQPELFAHCPYLDKVYSIRDKQTFEVYARFNHVMELFKFFGVKHSQIDTFDLISLPVGNLTLSFREKQLEYFAGEADQAEAFDVVLNTSETWPTRSWPRENWQRLADALLARGYRVAVVGKDVYSDADKMQKTSPALAGCVNLANRLSLDQTYFTIARARLFVSGQNGLSVLAGATQVQMIVLGMSIDWSKRAIYRNQNPLYRIEYLEGPCELHCCVTSECPRQDFSGRYFCHPDYETVEAAVLRQLASGEAAAAA